MFKDLGSREHGCVTQLEMWRYQAIWAGSHWSWNNTNSVSDIVLMQVFSTSHKGSWSTSKNKLSESSLISSLSSISSSPWRNQHRTSLRACCCSLSDACSQVTNWWQTVCDTGQQPCHINDVFAGGTAKGHPLNTIPHWDSTAASEGRRDPPILWGYHEVFPPHVASVPAKLYFYHLCTSISTTTALHFYMEWEPGMAVLDMRYYRCCKRVAVVVQLKLLALLCLFGLFWFFLTYFELQGK